MSWVKCLLLRHDFWPIRESETFVIDQHRETSEHGQHRFQSGQRHTKCRECGKTRLENFEKISTDKMTMLKTWHK